MSVEKKKNIDIEGLSTHMRNGFISIGMSMIAGYYAFTWLRRFGDSLDVAHTTLYLFSDESACVTELN